MLEKDVQPIVTALLTPNKISDKLSSKNDPNFKKQFHGHMRCKKTGCTHILNERV